jgi:PAS domain S-box-containing protein
MTSGQYVFPCLRRPEDVRRLLEAGFDGIWALDSNLRTRFVSVALAERLGYFPEEMLGRAWPEFLFPADRAGHAALQGSTGSALETLRFRLCRKDGSELGMQFYLLPLQADEGSQQEFLLLHHRSPRSTQAASLRKRTEQALLIGEKLATVGKLAATVAHEINNPLESVINLVYLAKAAASQAADPSIESYLGLAEEELGRIAQLTRQTLAFYRERSEKTRAPAAELLRQLVAVFTSKAQNKGLVIELEVVRDVEIEVDRTEFRQLLANLIGNSIDACQPRGRIQVRASIYRPGPDSMPGLRITVADNGSGIAPADRSRVFEPFFSTKQDVGTGLGLWVCHQIVEKYAGSIRVRSSSQPGRSGTVVSVFLPVIAAGSPVLLDAAKEVA